MTTHHVEVTRRMPLMEFPLRTSLVAVDGARILLAPASTMSRAQLEALGPVDAIAAPNLFHTEGMPQAAAVFPKAKLWGPAGAREKRPELAWEGVLGVDTWPYEGALAAMPVRGMPKANEIVFHDVAGRALHVADLVFNLQNVQGFVARMTFGMFGTRDRFAMSRLFAALVKDRRAFAESIQALLARDFDVLVPAHGAIVEADAKPMLRAAVAERGLG